MDRYEEMLSRYKTDLDDAQVAAAVEKIVRDNLATNSTPDVYQFLFSCIDLTSLHTEDNTDSITKFTKRVNDFEEEHPEMPSVAAICVYPNFAGTVRANLDVSSVNIAAVSGGFPTSQTFTEVKVAETALALGDGADEIGALKTASNIKKASLLSIYSGADFIKTSTGKSEPAATLEAAYVMCQAIKEYYEQTGTMIGFKPAGGISTTADAVKYYCVVKEVLGEKWLTNEYFRIGASRLANNLLSDIWGNPTKFF